MRRSKDQYTCEVLGTSGCPNLASKCEEVAELGALEGGRPSQASDEIVYTLFRNLVKQAEYGDSAKKLVLVKSYGDLEEKVNGRKDPTGAIEVFS